MRFWNGLVALAAIGGVAPAQAACWSPEEVAAAQVRDLQTMLMVAALRCRASGFDVLSEYNAFVRAQRNGIETMNGRIKARLRADSGPIEGQQRYDRFTTMLANAYGAGRTDAGTCAEAAGLARRGAAADGDAATLVALAREAVFATPLPEAACALPPALIAEAAPTPPVPGVALAEAPVR